MNAIALPRITIPELPKVELPSMQLLREASERISYHYRPPNVNEINFLNSLRDVGAVPFQPQAVEVYKKKMLKKARGSWLLDRLLPRSGRMAWRVTRMSLYRDPIPESVLQLAVDIHKKTHADIRVDHLGTRDFEREWQAWMQTYDPFLVVRADINSPWHHVAVWDEPTFQG